MEYNTGSYDEAFILNEESAQYAASFRDLHVYKKGIELARSIFLLSKQFPAEEKYSLTDQIRRSSRSITANIAEAWGKRSHQAHFISKLSDSLSETFETQTWLDHAFNCSYISQQYFKSADDLCNFVTAMIRNTSAKANQFCTTK